MRINASILISFVEYENKQNDETSATRYFCYQWLIFVRQQRSANQGIQLCAEDIFDSVDCNNDDCPLSFDCKLSKCKVELETRQEQGLLLCIWYSLPINDRTLGSTKNRSII